METEKSVKKQIDYSKSKIYKIVCNTTGLTYVGSTIQKLSQRLSEHKGKYKSYLKGKTNFITSFDIIKNNNYQIILIENCPCDSKEELHREERKYIENIECVNKIIPTRTEKEHYQDNKDKIKEYYQDNKNKIKKYYEDNKEQILERRKEYRENNKEKIKEYYLDNKEQILERIKAYRENNKDKILEQSKKTIQCEFCNSTITVHHLRRHQRTNKCQKFQLSI